MRVFHMPMEGESVTVNMKKSSCWFAILGLLAACAGSDPELWETESDEGEEARWGTVEQAVCSDVTGVAGFPGDPPDCDDWEANVLFEDDREELGTFTGNGQCVASEHPDFRGKFLALDKNHIFTFVGSKMNDKISSFRVASGCQIIAFRDRDQRGRQTLFRSDNSFVGHDEDDSISSFECRCR
ncbi:MAG: hypothetical protein RL685_5199 [Pseudomonadota bacterium]|jgi:hypothetical protein